MAKLIPSIDHILNMKVPPTDGELILLRFLDNNLDDSFEVYFNPYMNGDRPMQNMIMNIGNTERLVHRITVSTKQPMIHVWTFEDYRKGFCEINDIDEIELLPSGEPKVYNLISFLVRERIDDETQRWEGRNSDVEETFLSVWRWCYKSK